MFLFHLLGYWQKRVFLPFPISRKYFCSLKKHITDWLSIYNCCLILKKIKFIFDIALPQVLNESFTYLFGLSSSSFLSSFGSAFRLSIVSAILKRNSQVATCACNNKVSNEIYAFPSINWKYFSFHLFKINCTRNIDFWL